MIITENFIFIRNPKTGSASCMDAIQSNFPYEKRYPDHSPVFGPEMREGKTHVVTAVRNPWDRMVSAWAYTVHRKEDREKPGSFLEWLLGPPWMIEPRVDIKRQPQTLWTTQCTRVLRFENLQDDLNRFLKETGHQSVTMPHGHKTDRPPYRDVICEKARDIIQDRFLPDILEFGYEF